MSDRRFWEHNSRPGLVLISGVEYDVSRTPDGMIHCPVPTCSSVFKRRSTFKSHIEHHKDILEVPALAPQSNSSGLRNAPQQCVAVHPQVSAVTLAEGPFQLPDGEAPARVISPNLNNRVVLLPGENYLLSTCLLDQFGLCMHTALKILICMGCKKSHRGHGLRSPQDSPPPIPHRETVGISRQIRPEKQNLPAARRCQDPCPQRPSGPAYIPSAEGHGVHGVR